MDRKNLDKGIPHIRNSFREELSANWFLTPWLA